jgi:predicted nucleic acid-binding protein
MGSVVLDVDVVIAVLWRPDAQHQKAIKLLHSLEQDQLLMVASAYSEVLVKPVADGTDPQVEKFIDAFAIEIVPIDRQLARRAAQLRAAHPRLRLPDAFVLATARLREARLATFDVRLSKIAAA